MEEKKKKKRKKQSTFLVEEQLESQTFHELASVLDELEKEGKFVDVQVCPRCKSPKVRRVGTLGGDMLGHMGILPRKFQCKECGWRARLVLKTTNRPTSIKDVAIIAEAHDLEEAKERKQK